MRYLLALLTFLPGLALGAVGAPTKGTYCSADNAACTATLPSHAAGNALLEVCSTSSTGGTISTPSGWTSLHASTTAGRRLYVFGKVAASSSETSPTCTPSGGSSGDVIQGVSLVMTGTHTTIGSLVPDSSGRTSGTADQTIEGYGATGVANGASLIVWMHKSNNNAQTALSGYTAPTPDAITSPANQSLGYQYRLGNYSSSDTITVSGGGTGASTRIDLTIAPAAAPTFSADPTHQSATASTIVTRATTTQDTTLKGVLYADGGSAPTCAQIQAGLDASGNAAYATCSVSASAGVAADCTFSGLSGAGAGTMRDSAFCGTNANGNTAVGTVADRYKLPAWLTTPTATCSSPSSCTVSGELDGAGTTKVVGCARGSTAPDADEVAALTCDAAASPLASASDDATLSAALSSIVPPILDIYATGYYVTANKTTPTALADKCPPPASGKTVVNCPSGLTSIHANSPINGFNAVVTPDIVAGDIMVADSTTDLGDALTWTATGLYSYDGNSARRKFSGTFYDNSAKAMHADTMQVCVNNQLPIASPFTEPLVLVKDMSFAAYDFAHNFSDADDPMLTITTSDTGTGIGTDKRPAGTTTTGGVFDDTGSGPTSADGSTGSFTATATDSCGEAVSIDIPWEVHQQVTVPNCVGGSLSSCMTAMSAVNLEPAFASQCSPTVPALDVISQTPAASTVVDPFTGVSLVVSSGACGGRRGRLMLGIGVR